MIDFSLLCFISFFFLTTGSSLYLAFVGTIPMMNGCLPCVTHIILFVAPFHRFHRPGKTKNIIVHHYLLDSSNTVILRSGPPFPLSQCARRTYETNLPLGPIADHATRKILPERHVHPEFREEVQFSAVDDGSPDRGQRGE